MKFYKAMAIPTLTYWSELWTLTKMQEASIETPEMQFLRSIAEYKRIDQIRNSRIKEELNIFKLNDKSLEYRTNWEDHVLRTEGSQEVYGIILQSQKQETSR